MSHANLESTAKKNIYYPLRVPAIKTALISGWYAEYKKRELRMSAMMKHVKPVTSEEPIAISAAAQVAPSLSLYVTSHDSMVSPSNLAGSGSTKNPRAPSSKCMLQRVSSGSVKDLIARFESSEDLENGKWID